VTNDVLRGAHDLLNAEDRDQRRVFHDADPHVPERTDGDAHRSTTDWSAFVLCLPNLWERRRNRRRNRLLCNFERAYSSAWGVVKCAETGAFDAS
jgi:hypothetical protein